MEFTGNNEYVMQEHNQKQASVLVKAAAEFLEWFSHEKTKWLMG